MFCLDRWGIFIQEYGVFPEYSECKNRSYWWREASHLFPFFLFFISHSQTCSLLLPLSISLSLSISLFKSHRCTHPFSFSSPVLSLSALFLSTQVFYLSYPQRVSVSLGWRLKHLLNFIAVYIGLPSSQGRGRLCVCVCVSSVQACFCMCLQSLLSAMGAGVGVCMCMCVARS